MRLVFTKGSGRFDRLEVFRGTEETETIQCPKQRIIPHDMVHFAVESTLQKRGFLGRVKAGEDASFQMKPEAESDAVERLVEVFQGDEWSGGNSEPEHILEMYRVTCEARACAAMELDAGAVLAVRQTIADLSLKWQAVPVGGTLSLRL